MNAPRPLTPSEADELHRLRGFGASPRRSFLEALAMAWTAQRDLACAEQRLRSEPPMPADASAEARNAYRLARMDNPNVWSMARMYGREVQNAAQRGHSEWLVEEARRKLTQTLEALDRAKDP